MNTTVSVYNMSKKSMGNDPIVQNIKPKFFKVHFMKNENAHDFLVFTADTDMGNDCEFLRIYADESFSKRSDSQSW